MMQVIATLLLLLSLTSNTLALEELSASTTGKLDENEASSANLFGRCPRRGCMFMMQQMYKETGNSCENKCAFLGLISKSRGYKCGTCGDSTPVQIDESKFNTRLDLRQVNIQFQEAFQKAAARWDSVIEGDVPTYDTRNDIQGMSNCIYVPSKVDDLYICAEVSNIDGRGGVLGRAGSEFVREGNGLPITGRMSFDAEDVLNLIARDQFDNVILHEIGHIYGLASSSWVRKGLSSNCSYKADSNASREFQQITGCSSNIPVELEKDGGAGTACSHWDEQIFRGEVMTGYLSGGMEMSRITVGSLEDLGYKVNYAAADEYGVDKMDANYIKQLCGRRRLGEPNWLQDRLKDEANSNFDEANDSGRAKALQFGLEDLHQHAELRKEKFDKNSSTTGSLRGPNGESVETNAASIRRSTGHGAVYVADQFVSIIYLGDDDQVHSVAVTPEAA